MSGQLDSLADLPPGKSPSTHCTWGKLGQKTGCMFWRIAKSPTSPGNQNLYFPACSPVAVPVGCFQLPRSDILGLNCAATKIVNSGTVCSLYTYCSTCVFIQNTFQLIWKLFDSQVTKFVGNFEWWLIPSKCFLIFTLVKKYPLFMGPEQISQTPQLCMCAHARLCVCVCAHACTSCVPCTPYFLIEYP